MTVDSIPPAIHLTDICLSFSGNVHILKSLNLKIERGQHTALIGRSGAGKTSLLAIISGLLQPNSGQIVTMGQHLNVMDEDQLAQLRREKIGVVFQHFHLLSTMTALENVALPLEINRIDNAAEQATAMLNAVGLQERLHHFPAQLSGGEQQRVAIARAFAANPQLILADEPTGNLDDETSEQVLETLLQLSKKNNTTLLFVTHNTSILNRFNSVLEMIDGTAYAK